MHFVANNYYNEKVSRFGLVYFAAPYELPAVKSRTKQTQSAPPTGFRRIGGLFLGLGIPPQQLTLRAKKKQKLFTFFRKERKFSRLDGVHLSGASFPAHATALRHLWASVQTGESSNRRPCLLYTSDAADE